MITPEHFNKSDALRTKLFDALGILEIAMSAIAQDESIELLSTKHDVMELAISHGKQVYRIELMRRLRELAKRPADTLSPDELALHHMPDLDDIARQAEAEYASEQERIKHETK